MEWVTRLGVLGDIDSKRYWKHDWEKKMNIADKLIKGDIEPNTDELKFLLWNTLIQLSAYCDDVISVEEESFNIEQMLSTLDVELGAHPWK